MRISGIAYSIKQGIINIWRNKLFSIASIATMTACIFLFGLFYSVLINFQSMVQNIEGGVAVTVFFEDGISDNQIQAIGQAIHSRPEVLKYDYISAEQAWEEYKLQYFEGDEEAAEGFGDDNPLENSSSYEIYLNDVSQQSSLVEFLEGLEGVSEVRQSEAVARTLTDFNRLLAYISMGIMLVLFSVATFLIGNTVAIGISVRKEEIGIMKLIGASDYFVKAPFYVEGILIGVIGSILPLLVLRLVYDHLIDLIIEKFTFLSNLLTFLSSDMVFKTLIPISILLGVGMGFIGSAFTIQKHLKV